MTLTKHIKRVVIIIFAGILIISLVPNPMVHGDVPSVKVEETKAGYAQSSGLEFYSRVPTQGAPIYPESDNNNIGSYEMSITLIPKADIHTMEYKHFVNASTTYFLRAIGLRVLAGGSNEQLMYMEFSEDGKLYPSVDTIKNPFDITEDVSTEGTYCEFVDVNNVFKLSEFGKNATYEITMRNGTKKYLDVGPDFLILEQKEWDTFEDMEPAKVEFGLKFHLGQDMIDKVFDPYPKGVGIFLYNTGDPVANYYTNMTASITKPFDYYINPGTSISLDTTISSTTEDGEALPWYGTFQVKKVGSNQWVDLDDEYMEDTTLTTKPEFNLTVDESFKGASIRYKYVYSMDVGEGESQVLYGPSAKIYMPFGVTYNSNKADSGSIEDPSRYWAEESVTIKENDGNTPLVREGYKFVGWNTKANGKGQSYKPGEVIEIQNDMLLYAIWEKIEKPINKPDQLGSSGSNAAKDEVKSGTDSKTADSVFPIGWFTLMLVCLGVVIGLVRKKNN